MADYSREQLLLALRRADAAGDPQAAQAIARRLSAMPALQSQKAQQGGASQPEEQPGYATQRLSELRSLGQGARYSLANTALGLGQLVGSGVDMLPGQKGNRAEIDDKVRSFREMREIEAANGGEFFSGGEMLGDAGQAAIPISKAASLSKLGYAANTGLGAAFGATRPVLGGESRGENTLWGAGLGAFGQATGDIAAAVGRKAPQTLRDIYHAAKARGLELTPAQLADSEFIKRLSLMTDRLPFSGAKARRSMQAKQVNKGLADLIGENADTVDAGVMGRAYDRMGQEFDDVFATGVKYDRQFLKDIASIKREAKESLDETAAKSINNWTARVRTQSSQGQLSGKTLKSLDQKARKAQTGGGDRQQVAEQFREALHENFSRNAAPGIKPRWDTVRRQYATYKTIEPLVARNPEGPISPTQILGAVNSSSRGRARMARGEAGELGELAIIGQRMRGPTSSGTAENTQAAATGAGFVANAGLTLGLLGIGNATGRALNSPLLARYLMSDRRGGLLSPLAPYARPFPLLWGGSAYADEPERP